ncbi:hypothetical protein GSI_13181 [Ganoderma sinense ZZ0214-1]|uniref:Uncharacterized protein n=1 Tax=Ganoderma sinense ZZ0214-1 TaxID=1077348 RepID=A0A2G8RUV0_9APHY|nr:hypothetical protein GSI_13181 [Ganoderma sinense ZZ0214-1]
MTVTTSPTSPTATSAATTAATAPTGATTGATTATTVVTTTTAATMASGARRSAWATPSTCGLTPLWARWRARTPSTRSSLNSTRLVTCPLRPSTARLPASSTARESAARAGRFSTRTRSRCT